MNCRELRSGLLEWARGGVLQPKELRVLRTHIEHCPECASLLESHRSMEAAIRRLAREPLPAAEAIEARVLAEFDRKAAQRRPAKVAARWVVAVAMAASILLAAFVTLRRTPAQPAPAVAVEEVPFLTIPYTIPIGPEERAEVVRMRIPVAALLAAGFRVQVSDPSGAIDADALVSQDGRVRAIRPLSGSISN
ncbi:MAG TPA: hypothetical protein VKU19_40435 [Bryobacteraceae bacterium]|nr:hypothetical protein [Bryobacteraceae bacterium]